MGVSARTTEALRAEGFDAIHLNDEGLNRLADSAILLKARDENRVVLTFDLDFGELLAASGGETPSVVIFRMSDRRPVVVLDRTRLIFGSCREVLLAGAIVVVEDSGYRVRRLPLKWRGGASERE